MSGKTILPLFCLCLMLVSCSGTSSTAPAPSTTVPPAPTVFTVQASSAASLLTAAQRTAMGFQYGPPDGTLGVLLDSGAYTFFAAARSSSACKVTPSTQGTYRLGGTLSAISAPYSCQALITPSTAGDLNGYTFDQDYAGGGGLCFPS